MDPLLAAAAENGWSLLTDGVKSRKSPLHTLAVASLSDLGCPDQRIMVLRSVDPASATLTFNTDVRSPKTAQIAGQRVHILGYHPDAAVQLRLAGLANLHSQDDVAEVAWAAATNFARRCYLAEQAPGTALPGPASGLPGWVEGKQPSDRQVAPARANFAVIRVVVDRLDWLHLANSGHRRALFLRDGQHWAGQWLAP